MLNEHSDHFSFWLVELGDEELAIYIGISS